MPTMEPQSADFSLSFLSSANPFLLQAEIAAAVLLGIGIVFESEKYPRSVHESAFWFVVIGVVLETIFSILLFASEEMETRIANATAAIATERAAAVMKATAWRGFTDDEVAKLRKNLSKRQETILIGWITNDSESLYLAIQFSNIVKTIKWNVAPDGLTFPTSLVWGTRIPDESDMDTVRLLRHAFTDAGIHFATTALPKQTGIGWQVTDQQLVKGRAVVFFGSKLPTFLQPPH